MLNKCEMNKLFVGFLCSMMLLLLFFAQGVSGADAVISDKDIDDDDEETVLPFTDVTTEHWFYENVKYVYENGLMKGTEDTLFSPGEPLTRGMAVTVLYRLDGEPETDISSFKDVSSDAYYASAVSWGEKQGIVKGFDTDKFGPEMLITREQMVSILYRYATYHGGNLTQRSNMNIYEDRGKISSYAYIPMAWAVAVSLVKGESSTTLNPLGYVTRAEFSAFIQRLSENITSDEEVMNPDTTYVPVLMLHSIVESDPGTYSITTDQLESIVSELKKAGYNTISYEQLKEYVYNDGSLPQNPVIFSFDDGYVNNLTYGLPIFEKYGFCFEIAVIGAFMGCSSYNDISIEPHFSFSSLKSVPTNILSIQSHTMNMHMDINSDIGRMTVNRLADESDEEYYNALKNDFEESYNQIENNRNAPVALVYPHGVFTTASETVAREVGYAATVTVRSGGNYITAGNADSLYLLNRIEVKNDMTASELIAEIQSYCED